MSFLPAADRRYLADRGLPYKEVVDGATKGVIFEGFRLPGGRFDIDCADILILLPASYPDAAPDMFYLMPWARLAATNGFPRAANQPVAFTGQQWQRWSRHNGEWRPGVDGIWTMLKRIEHALEAAA